MHHGLSTVTLGTLLRSVDTRKIMSKAMLWEAGSLDSHRSSKGGKNNSSPKCSLSMEGFIKVLWGIF